MLEQLWNNSINVVHLSLKCRNVDFLFILFFKYLLLINRYGTPNNILFYQNSLIIAYQYDEMIIMYLINLISYYTMEPRFWSSLSYKGKSCVDVMADIVFCSWDSSKSLGGGRSPRGRALCRETNLAG